MADDPWYAKLAVLVIAAVVFGAGVAGWVMIFEFALWMFGR